MKIILIILGVALLARPILRLVLGFVVKKGVERQFPNQQSKQKKPKGTVTIEPDKGNGEEGFSDYEEIK
jgi:hypothetical protein